MKSDHDAHAASFWTVAFPLSTMKPAIAIENVSKLYRLGSGNQGGYRTLREALAAPFATLRQRLRGPGAPRTNGTNPRKSTRAAGPRDADLWALKDVTFAVEPGEVVGIIGRNGAGKSTLLKILSRITEPTSGRVAIRGCLGSLLEVGTGFHHELTGRENIYLSGAILGMPRRQINRRFDEIVAFSEVERFLDTPVKHYSSGMYVRLAFAVASHLEPDILVVDEVLAVGDAAFQRKCLGKMDQASRSGRTVLFVSHNMATILNLCDKVALLDHGRLVSLGECEQGVQRYTRIDNSQQSEARLESHRNRRPGCQPILSKIRLLDAHGVPTNQFLCGQPLTVELSVDPACTLSELHFAVGFDDHLGCRLFTAATYLSGSGLMDCRRGRTVACHLDCLPLPPGRYALTLNAGPLHAAWSDVVDQAIWLDVMAADFYGNGKLPNPDWGRFLVRSQWDLKS
jgi:lipopolysaccharide transport system ATP-binding protein